MGGSLSKGGVCRFQTVRWMWRNKLFVLSCLCIVCSMAWQLREQVQRRIITVAHSAFRH